MQVPMPELLCAQCLRQNIEPFAIQTPVTNGTAEQARAHFNREHLPKMDARSMVVHVEFPDGDGQPTFDLRYPRAYPLSQEADR